MRYRKNDRRHGGLGLRARLCLVVLAASNAMAAAGENGRRLRVDVTQKPWAAVGQVNNNAYGRCTGVLVARDMAVTAAHCLFNHASGRFLQPQSIHFVLGYDRGAYAFRTVARSVRTGPAYDPGRAGGTWGSDWALIELAAPAPASIEPIAPADGLPEAGSELRSAGFGRDRLYALTAVGPCTLLPSGSPQTIVAACSIVEGYSGGPLLDAQDRLVGIQVASGRRDGQDLLLAVPSAAWSGFLKR